MTLNDAMNKTIPPNVRLMFVILLLLHQAHSLIIEICYMYTQQPPIFKEHGVMRALLRFLRWEHREVLDPTEPPPTWTRTARTQWVVVNGLVMFFIGLLFSGFTFRRAADIQRGIDRQCDIGVDGDIAGIGVRTAIWIQIAMLIFIVGINVFIDETSETAVKELGGGLVVTHVSLAISIMVLMGQGRLSALDAAIGAMILDAQNAALSVSLGSKDVLAARWEVVIICVSQFTSLVCIGLLMSRYQVGRYEMDDCRCFSFFWWGWHDTCSGVPRAETSIFWVYYDFRWLNAIHNWLFGFRYMFDFHFWESDARKAGDMAGRKARRHMERPFWGVVPSTVGFSLLRHSVFGIVSMTAAELTLSAHDAGEKPEEFSIGQVTGIVVAGITILRAVWLFLMVFKRG